jgi:hypothetical protein
MVVPNPPHQGNFGKTRFQTVVLSAITEISAKTKAYTEKILENETCLQARHF